VADQPGYLLNGNASVREQGDEAVSPFARCPVGWIQPDSEL
jgi:hypothetical protein